SGRKNMLSFCRTAPWSESSHDEAETMARLRANNSPRRQSPGQEVDQRPQRRVAVRARQPQQVHVEHRQLPVREQLDQPPFGNHRVGHVVALQTDADPGQYRIADRLCVVAAQHRVDPYGAPSTPAGKRPQSATTISAEGDAAVYLEIGGVAQWRSRGQVIRRGTGEN